MQCGVPTARWALGSAAGGLTSTGAFEVALDGAPLYSTLAEGGVPGVEELARRLVAAGLEPSSEGAAALGLGALVRPGK